MKKQLIILSGAVLFALAACNSNGTDSKNNPVDSSFKTTTTTATTTTKVHTIPNFEHRTFVSLKSQQPVTIRIDTVNHYYIDAGTNQEPDYYYFDPIAHDTFDYRGRLLNNALVLSDGNYTIDETRVPADETDNSMMGSDTSTTTPASAQGNLKVKQKDDMYKEKTDTSKLKITDKKLKVKTK